MSIRIAALPAEGADDWLVPAVHVYVTAMGYPRGTETHRTPLWRDHISRPGWTAFGAYAVLPPGHRAHSGFRRLLPGPARFATPAPGAETLVGIAYGYRGSRDQWWNQQLRSGLRQAGCGPAEIDALTASYFELTELHVHPVAQGRGAGEALLTALLADRPENHVLLSTPEIPGEQNRAWALYRRLGFRDVLRHFIFAGDPRPFAFLGRDLPLPASPPVPPLHGRM